MKVKETEWGIACRIENTIYINKNLEKQDFMLYLAILNHELQHSSGYSWKDIKLDLRNEHLNGLKGKYYKFILKNPKSLVEFLPFWVYEKHFAINPSMLAIYGIFLILLGVILFLM